MKKIFLILTLFLVGGIVKAQSAYTYVQAPAKASSDMFQSNLYSADRIMEMREKLNLTETQASKIKKIHADNAGQFSTLKWDLDEENAKLKKLLGEDKIDAAAVSKQLDMVLNLENQLKKKQLSTLVAIKNELTPEQVKTLSKSQTYVIRGTGSTAPLKIVDGVPMASSVNGTISTSPKVAVSVNGNGEQPLYFLETKSGMKKVLSFEQIDPKDIESVSVLKGEQALEKYGADGKNGVVVIKLKNMPE
ncbi:Spy/CpxP family protein refolding chaperone [Algoriphagus boseongensis]|uniref:Spy/CpxP family protein refolding chaperone n=1 Tax=Algoriphagus boseongensis TaxID=1442587 RepID=A0A4V3D1U6_9BACT|nr:Spy/CpxP family protein refolding chaperone [Algoriphagus boseongensis]TDQ14602.1 Spy/CpxP family protein refolding chaperone [Algoriphagus boseongensis]